MIITFTPGEPAGIGVDLAILYAQQNNSKNLLVFSDPDLLVQRAKKLNLKLKIIEAETASKTGELCVFPIKTKVTTQCGVLNVDNVDFVLATLDAATEYCLAADSRALLTGPVHKGIINQAGIAFSGHTEYLAKRTNSKKTVMMLATDGLRVALATTHLPLSKVAQNINANSLQTTIELVHRALIKWGIKKPVISVCGLNPHAGEGGYLGFEEIKIINPLIKKLNSEGYHLKGAVPADTAFTPDALVGVDAVLAMYHDQGLPVLKTIGFKKSVNITLGLPFVRTSVDHGTALNLAGTGKISLGSFYIAKMYAQKLLK